VYEKRDRRYPLSIEMGTPAVPADGKYHVVDRGEVVLSTAVLDYALIEFDERRERHRIAAGHPDPLQLRQQERARQTLTAMRREAVTQRGKRGKGGKGGRGGV
jgi:hypothetical protein